MGKDKLKDKLALRIEELNILIEAFENDIDLARNEEELVLESITHQLKLCARMCLNLSKR